MHFGIKLCPDVVYPLTTHNDCMTQTVPPLAIVTFTWLTLSFLARRVFMLKLNLLSPAHPCDPWPQALRWSLLFPDGSWGLSLCGDKQPAPALLTRSRKTEGRRVGTWKLATGDLTCSSDKTWSNKKHSSTPLLLWCSPTRRLMHNMSTHAPTHLTPLFYMFVLLMCRALERMIFKSLKPQTVAFTERLTAPTTILCKSGAFPNTIFQLWCNLEPKTASVMANTGGNFFHQLSFVEQTVPFMIGGIECKKESHWPLLLHFSIL